MQKEIVLELFTDLPSALQVQSGARVGMSVRADTTMFAQPVPCIVTIATEIDPYTKLKSACEKMLREYQSSPVPVPSIDDSIRTIAKLLSHKLDK